MQTFWSKAIRIAPYLLLGPVSGPLLYRVQVNIREDRPLLAALYTVVVVQYLVLLFAVGARVRPSEAHVPVG